MLPVWCSLRCHQSRASLSLSRVLALTPPRSPRFSRGLALRLRSEETLALIVSARARLHPRAHPPTRMHMLRTSEVVWLPAPHIAMSDVERASHASGPDSAPPCHAMPRDQRPRHVVPILSFITRQHASQCQPRIPSPARHRSAADHTACRALSTPEPPDGGVG